MKNFKHLVSVFVFVCLATMLVACKSTSVVPPTTTETVTTKTVKEVIRDTVFITPKDSSYYKAYLECVNGQVVISKPLLKKGNYLQPPSVNIKDNILQVDCQAEAQKLFAKWKDNYTTESKATIQKIPYPIEKQLSWWQITQIWCGRLFLFSLFVLVSASVYKRYTNI